MSINFSTLKGLTIPEGNVVEIKDESGAVIWKAKPKEATITLTFLKNSLSNQSSMTSVVIDGISYPVRAGTGDDMTTKEIVVPIGTIITCKLLRGGTGFAKVTLNGETVLSGVGEYEYTVIGNATIESTGMMTGPTAEHAIINITEL